VWVRFPPPAFPSNESSAEARLSVRWPYYSRGSWRRSRFSRAYGTSVCGSVRAPQSSHLT